MNEPIRNDVRLEGLVPEPPVLSHENHGTRFFRCQLSVPRLSGQEDLLPVLLPEAMAARIQAGEPLRQIGRASCRERV